MISQSTFENLCNSAGENNIATINGTSSGESVLAAYAVGGGGISEEEEADIIEYMDDKSFQNVYDSNGNLNWLLLGKKDPC